jgi:TonB family protein
MDSPGYNNDENKWVEERIARLSPPPEWRPDTDKAFERVLQRGKPKSLSSGPRLLMAGATIAVIAVVIVLLPWKALWRPEASERTAATPQMVKPAQTTRETPGTSEVPVAPVPQSPAVIIPERDHTSAQDQDPRSQTPVIAPDAQSAPRQHEPEIRQQIPDRRKKEPRPIIAALEPQQETVPSIAESQAGQPPPGGVTPPVVIYQIQPRYTDEARQARIQGTVELSVTVREDGTVKVERVVRGLGYGLDEAATAAVEQWKFIPGKKDGQPVAVTTNVLIHFSLK